MSFPASLRSTILVAGVVVVLSLMPAMQGYSAEHEKMGLHMEMTTLRPVQPGDRERAAAVVAAARKTMDQYTDYRKALANGYTIYLPGIKQSVYHFTHNGDFHEDTIRFDPNKPASLLYVRVSDPGLRYKLVGVMYTAPDDASEDELNQRIPLSIAQWHLHTNLCVPMTKDKINLHEPEAKFGFSGSIATADTCQAAGGHFVPHFFGWMVHVYAYETDPAKVWIAGMGDERGMQHNIMAPGMTM
jgi:hypothetical protein